MHRYHMRFESARAVKRCGLTRQSGSVLSTVSVALLVLILLSSPSNAGETFRSFNGGFAITLPDGWSQIDYRTADYHLANAGADLNYEAAFDGDSSDAVFAGEYLILTLDTTSGLADSSGALIAAEVDSLLASVTADFDTRLVRIGADAYQVERHQDVVAYDTTNHIAYAISTMDGETGGARRNLLAMKLYENGAANFFFYADESTFAESLVDFQSILASFTTDLTATVAGPAAMKCVWPTSTTTPARRVSPTPRWSLSPQSWRPWSSH